MAIDLTGIVDWLKGWFYDKSEVNTYLNAKANKNLTNANMNVVTDASGDITTEAKPTIPDVSGKIDTAGTGLSKSGTTLNHSNSVTAQNSAVFKKFKYDGQGHITGTAEVSDTDLPGHNHSTTQILEGFSLSNIGTNAHASQHDINVAINTVIGTLSSIKAIEVVSTRPTADSSTMGKLYIVSENSNVNVYYTEQSGTGSSATYSWHKMDTDILDELSVNWSDVQNKPSSFTPSAHASSSNTYGLGTTSAYGHVKTINGLTQSSHQDGTALSAYQGNILKGLIDDLDDALADFDASTVDYEGNAQDWGAYLQVVSTVEDALTVLKQIQNTKQDAGDCVTSIALVPKSTDSTGAIRLYYGDEPTS